MYVRLFCSLTQKHQRFAAIAFSAIWGIHYYTRKRYLSFFLKVICHLANKRIIYLDIPVKTFIIMICQPSVIPIRPMLFWERNGAAVGMIVSHCLLVAHHLCPKP